jgi:hypothetical protein
MHPRFKCALASFLIQHGASFRENQPLIQELLKAGAKKADELKINDREKR